jgi:formate dehydrogenase iron-sulfur subunit
MTIKIYVPIDSTAQSLGANEVAIAIELEAQKKKS